MVIKLTLSYVDFVVFFHCIGSGDKKSEAEKDRLMRIGIPKESLAGETRVACTPATVAQLL